MNLLGKCTDKSFWKDVREKECYAKFREKYLTRWELECENTPPNSLRYSDWTEFWVSGRRIEFNYFQARQQMMASAFLSLIYPEEEKYLKRLMDQIFIICNEYTWCVPAHYGRPEEGNRAKIDLFAAETALALSEIYTILEDRLDSFIKRRIREELNWRIVESMRETPRFGFETMSNNWSSVCTACVAGTVMLIFPDCFYEFKPRFDSAIECYLSGYKNDGVCLEGASYWNYGFGFFSVYADMLRIFSDGKYNYFENEKVKRIATFLQKTFLTENVIVSFSDGGKYGSFNVGHLHLLKALYPDDVALYKSDFSTARDGCARFSLALRSVMWFNENYYYNTEEATVDFTFYAEDSQWFIRRTPTFGFAAKAGHNKEPHNHNDVGSFIYAKSGDHILTDLGPGAYTKQYFSGERYKTFQACSRSHSVPIIGGEYQKNGSQYSSKNVSCESGVFSMDISGAYESEALTSLVRRFEVLPDGIMLTDTVEYSGAGVVTERFVTLMEPEIGDGTITVGDGVITYDPSVAVPYVLTEILSEEKTCYMINFDLPKGTKTFTITVK